MYAVVSTGGKQAKVAKDDTVAIEKLDAAVGDTVNLPVLLVADGDNLVADAAGLANATVTAEVVGHGKADKVIIFKFKKRKGYKRLKGHRQPLTLVRITDVNLGGAAKPAKKAAEAPAEETPKPKRTTKKAEASAEAAPKPKRTSKKAEAVEAPAAEAAE